ncbi:serine hydrolase domain-containing protein [Allorhizocola rhizosphaerae]|uniref:serine hydrolase domain-containing protein n=1 Tax=Allorhizocola rhizosphaerae TaxID=1872709 RepID=UPI000E3B592B|nr:serine hydrolase domain-containing protein [Allorhizocola rhizosphaerae]
MFLPSTSRSLLHRVATAQVEGRTPSLMAAVLREGEQVWSHAIGAEPGTQYRIGSLTKTFVAVLVMRLRDEGRLDLADRIDDHLPGTGLGAVTVGQLLSHTAGLASESPGPWWERTPGDLRPTLADVLGDEPMKHPSGRRFHYSNPGFAVLGALVEKLRGRPWGEALRDEILEPLGMTRTSLFPQDPHATGCAVHPWADVLQPERVQDTGTMAPAGQLWSTVDDLCRFARLLAGGAADVLSPDTAAEMRTPHAASTAAAWDAGYGLGMQMLRTSAGRILAGHTGSMPGFLCALWISVDDAAGAVALTNTTSGPQIGALVADLVSIVAEQEPRIPQPWKPLPEVDQKLLELTGPWYWGPTAFVLRLEADRHLALSTVGRGGAHFARFKPGAVDGTWIGLDGYFHGETLRPGYDNSGRLTHFDVGTFIFTREAYDPAAPIPGGVDPEGWRAASDFPAI